MRKLLIFTLLLFASCEVHENIRICRFEMIFSDGLPVQFWLADCETFNQKEVDGINRACWCQPWQCDDEINIQFQADEISPEVTYYLLAKDRAGSILAFIEIDEIDTGVYAASITPEDENICNESIQLTITDEFEDILTNSSFEASLSPWDNTGSGTSWTWDASGAAKFSFTDGQTSANLRQSVSTLQPGQYHVEIKCRFTVPGVSGILDLSVAQGFGNYTFHQQSVTGTDLITIILHDEDITSLGEFDEIRASMFNVTSDIAGAFVIESYKFYLLGQDLAKSDCLHIKTAHSGTQLIEYSNNRNYAGLIYEDVSPEQSFFLRVPGVFFHKRFPQESRAIERTTSTVVTSSKMKKQRLLQVEHVPEYFHEKIILALSHHNVEIDGKQWKKEEGYEVDEGDLRYPLKKATCYLTEKNFLARNAL